MQFKVFWRTLSETRLQIIAWAGVLAGVVWLSLLIYPLFQLVRIEQDQETIFIRWLVYLLAGDNKLVSLESWCEAVSLGTFLPLILGTFAVLQGSWLIAGEEERGLLSLLLASPLRRSHLVVQKYAVLLTLVLMCSVSSGLSVSLVSLVGVLSIPFVEILRTSIALFLFGLGFGGLALALGSLIGKQRMSRNVILLFGLLTFLASRLPITFPGQAIARWFSPFHYYALAQNGRDYFLNILVLFLIAISGLGVTFVFFENRDLPV